MNERILFVDDDANLLASCERNLRRQFAIETAEGGAAALDKVAQRGPYAVVVSDRQMPLMDGIELLSTVRQRAPDTVRIMLTGNADLEAAIRVVNEGNIFRFLTKPCPADVLSKALVDGLAQYRLVTAERELLSKTLSGTIKLLTDILSTVDVQAFGRSQRLRDLIGSVGDKVSVGNVWELHVAAMLSPVGSVTIPAETLLKSRAGKPLSKVEEQMVERLPDISARLLTNIPRLEGVAHIVRYREKHFDGSGFPADAVAGGALPAGARLLKILADMMELEDGGVSRLLALEEMQQRRGWYDPETLFAVRACFGAGPAEGLEAPRQSVAIPAKSLAVGMVLRTNIETKEGTLILTAGHQISEMTLEKIQNFERVSGLKEPIYVEAPPALAAATSQPVPA